MKRYLFGMMLCLIFLLSGCGMQGANTAQSVTTPEASATPEPTPTPTPTPTPVPALQFPDGSTHMADETALNLKTAKHADVPQLTELLKQMPNLKTVDLGSDGAWSEEPPELTLQTASVERPEEATRDLTWADIRALQDAAPDAAVLYRFMYYGRCFTTQDEEMDLNHSQMTDDGAGIREILPCMQRLTYLDMDSCGVPSEQMAELRDAYPNVDVVWRIWFGYEFSCRTDIDFLMNSYFAQGMTDELTKDLKYCTKVRRLDMGHNRELHDWSFLSYMPDLEICIITDSGWETLDMLSGCTKLEYLEAIPISHTYVDLTPLGTLTNLEHLNICGIGESDGWEVLQNLTKLKRLWIGHWTAASFPDGAIETLQKALPDTEINITEMAAAVGTWRDDYGDGIPERYLLLREQMQYDNYWNVIPKPENDPKYNPPWYR